MSGDPLRYVNTECEIVRPVDARVPVTNVKTQAAQIDQTMNQETILAKLCTAFALLALFVACVPVCTARWPTRWHSVRVRWDPTALGISRFVGSFLSGVKPNSPAALMLSVVILLSAVPLAGYVHSQNFLSPNL